MNNVKLFVPVILLSMAAGFFGGAVSIKYFFEPPVIENYGQDRNSTLIVVEESETTASIAQVSPAVVSIVALKDVPVGGPQVFDNGPFNIILDSQSETEYEYQEVSGGTGFIVNEGGLVLTNRHVVQDEEADYKVVLNDGTEYEAEVVSRDPFDDIAVVQIQVNDQEQSVKFPFVEFGSSDDLKVGQTVVAIGNALARYDNTATEGIISAKGRDVSAYNEGAGLTQNLSGLLQTDAAINFGNSGGPLVNLQGQVVGMNTAVANAAQGIGFAIPSDELVPILKSVEEYGEIVRPVLGVRFVMLTEEEAMEMDENLEGGALLVADELAGTDSIIEGGAADEAGIEDLDVIVMVDEHEVNLDNPLHKVIRGYAPGDVIKVKVWRNGEYLEFDVTLKSSQELKSELAE